MGGIYLMSSVVESTKIWKCKVRNKAVGKNGNIEHMREFLPSKNCWNGMMEPGKVYRITDRTPLDCLPLKTETKVQFFRITTSKVPFWCQDHYTANPNGVLPEIVSDGQILTDWKEEAFKLINYPLPQEEEEDTNTSAPCSCVSTGDLETTSIDTQAILHLRD